MRRTKSISGCANSSNEEPAGTLALPCDACIEEQNERAMGQVAGDRYRTPEHSKKLSAPLDGYAAELLVFVLDDEGPATKNKYQNFAAESMTANAGLRPHIRMQN